MTDMMQSQNDNYRPQDDFYLHVNKKWLDDPKNKIPDDYSRWGGFMKLRDDGLVNQIGMMDELATKFINNNLNEEEQKIYAIWLASQKRFEGWKTGSINYDAITKEFDNLDSYINNNSTIIELAKYLHYTQISGIKNIFDFDCGPDLTNSNNVVLDFTTSGLSLPSREYYIDEKFNEKVQMFKQHLENVKQLVNYNFDENFVQNVLDFENELAKYQMKQEQKRKYDEYYTNTTLTDLYKNMNGLNSLSEKQDNYVEHEKNFLLTDDQLVQCEKFFETVYELFDFRNVLKTNLTNKFVNIVNSPNVEHITVYDGDSVRRVMNLVLTIDIQKYKSFLQYKIVKSFGGFCAKELDEEFFDFYSKKLNGQQKQLPNDKRSINIVNIYAGEMLGKLYVEKFFPEECKIDMKNMIKDVIGVMSESIVKNDWLTEPTKKNALVKLNKFNVKIGYPDVWKDYSSLNIVIGDTLCDIFKSAKKWSLKVDFYDKLNSVVDKNEWHMTPQTVNAYFSPQLNEIVFPAAILQPPFYFKNAKEIDFDIDNEKLTASNITYSANLGGIGAVIAHEITHGYDDKGRKFDGDGNLNDWWTDEDTKLFKEKTNLMAEQADKYVFIVDNKEFKMNPELTMGENLADLGGISLALKTLTKKLTGCTTDALKSNQKILFKSFANIWREQSKTDFKINALTTDPHAPVDFRANLVKNMEEFYELFDVNEGDTMYLLPCKRVRMW